MSSDIIHNIKKQQTFVMIKPDAVGRGLIGKIIDRFEQKQLKVVALKMVHATREQIMKHYPSSDQAWVTRLGKKSL